MSLLCNDVYIYATAKVSSRHVMDQDFLYGIASNKNADYVYRGARNSVIVNLRSIATAWDNILETLCADGWDSDCLPGLIRLFQVMVEQKIFCIEFHEAHPKVRWADWFTSDTFIHIKPIAYGVNLFLIMRCRRRSRIKPVNYKHSLLLKHWRRRYSVWSGLAAL